MIRGCIFDLDGVVVDTARYHYLAWKRLAEGLGFVFTEEHNERLKGVSRMASLEILLEVGKMSLPDEEKEVLAAQKNSWYLDYIHTMTPADVLPGVLDFIQAVRASGKRIALGTASRNAMLILEQIGLESAFDSVVDGNRVRRAKPDPEVFLIAASDLGLQPEQCLVFEDAIAGIEAAHNGGMRCIGVGNPDILHQADRIIPGFEKATLALLEF
jgi:beta-phosphoglucomutase